MVVLGIFIQTGNAPFLTLRIFFNFHQKYFVLSQATELSNKHICRANKLLFRVKVY